MPITTFITRDELDPQNLLRIVGSGKAGGNVLFSGTTRDNFEGSQLINQPL